jgi:hypothetical protein
MGTAGADLTDTSGILTLAGGWSSALSPRPRIVGGGSIFGGGRIGSLDWSNVGGSFLCGSTEELLVMEDPVRAWFKDSADTVELIDELDAL